MTNTGGDGSGDGTTADESDSSPLTAFTLFVIVAITLGLITLILGAIIGWLVLFPQSNIAGFFLEWATVASGDSTDPPSLLSVIQIATTGVGITGSLTLSAVLAAIYLSQNEELKEQTEIQRKQASIQEDHTGIQRDQAKIQRDQTKIQDRQAEIMRGSYIPTLAAHDDGAKLHSGRPSFPKDTNPESLPFKNIDYETVDEGHAWVSAAVTNHGDQVAEQIQFACLIDYGDDIEVPDPLSCTVCDAEVDGMHTKQPHGKGCLLPPDDRLSLLRGRPTFEITRNGTAMPKQLVRTVRDLLKAAKESTAERPQEDYIRLGFILIYTNSIGNIFELPLEPAYSVHPGMYDDLDQLSVQDIISFHNRYEIEQLKEDIDWELPTEEFSREEFKQSI